jgi:hypothetical protein
MFEGIRKFIQSTDFLGYRQTIKIDNQKSHKNTLGGLLSIIIILLSASCTMYLSLDFLAKGDPIVLNSKSMNDNFGPYPYDKSNIELFIALEYSNFSFYMDESIYRVSAYQTLIQNVNNENGTISQNVEEIPLDVVKCIDYYSAKDIAEKGISFPIELFYCLKPGQPDIQGY